MNKKCQRYVPLLECENKEHIQLWEKLYVLVCDKSDDGTKQFSEILSNTPDNWLKCECIYAKCLESVIETSHVEMFEVLCRSGMDIKMLVYIEKDTRWFPQKFTVLHKLALHARSKVFDFLTIAKRYGSLRANINLQDSKGMTVVHYASCNNIGNVLPFAMFGARYDIADYDGLLPIQYALKSLKDNYDGNIYYGARVNNSYEMLRIVEKGTVICSLTHLFRLLAMGSTYQEHGQALSPLIHLEYSVVKFGTSCQRYMLIDSGYKFTFLQDLQSKDSELKSVIEEVQQAMTQPLTLEKQAANFLRTRLQPNAFVGAERLGLPPGFNKSIITLGVCGEEACTECAQRTCRYVPSTCSGKFLRVARNMNNM